MTNERAVEILNLDLDILGQYGDETAEAYKMAIKALEQYCEDAGELSDGYHTFNQLYHQRAILFATIVNQNKDKAWKSFKHSDGHYCFNEDGEMFIVGIDTPKGSYTYHYHKKYWDYFDCKELEYGKVWDGHTEEDVTRLLSLEQQPSEDCISRQAVEDSIYDYSRSCDVNYEQIMEFIDKLPSVTPSYNSIKTELKPCEDCISRESLRQKLQENYDFFVNAYGSFKDMPYNDKSRVDEIDNCIAMVVNAPSVTPQRPKGKWIRVVDKAGHWVWECDCKWQQRFATNYCPNCGAYNAEIKESADDDAFSD